MQMDYHYGYVYPVKPIKKYSNDLHTKPVMMLWALADTVVSSKEL